MRLASAVPLGMVLFTACVGSTPKGGPMSAGAGGSAGSGSVPFGQAGMDGTATGTAGSGTGTAGSGDGGAIGVGGMGVGGMGVGGTGVGAGGMGVGGTGTGTGGMGVGGTGTGTGRGGTAGPGAGGAAGGPAACTSNPADYQYPFQDPCKPLEDRVTNLLSLLTADEKVSMLYENQPAVTRLGIPFFTTYTEGLHGVGWSKVGSTAQSRVVATQFPQAFGLAQSWDPEAMRIVGDTMGVESRVYYARWGDPTQCCTSIVIRAPVIDLGRDPRWGRTEESYGEDPYLTTELAKGFLSGLHGGSQYGGLQNNDRALPHGRVDAQALPRLQQRNEPQQERLGRRRPEHERVLPDAVSRGDQGGQGRRHHDLVQQDLRRSRDDLAAHQEPRLRTMEVRRPGGHRRVRAERPPRRDRPQLHGDGLVAGKVGGGDGQERPAPDAAATSPTESPTTSRRYGAPTP